VVEGQGRTAAIPHVFALDGARGMAVAGVLLFHSGHLRGGYLGVDFFFTLSGFLITSLLLAESGRTGSVGLGGFWARRARRLLPALCVLMVGVALYAVTLAKPTELSQIRGDAFATLAYGANWRAVYTHLDYWAVFRASSPLNHTWSLAIEEQFYLIWPLLFVGLLAWWKHNVRKAVLVTSLVLASISSVLMVVLYSPDNNARAYFGTDTRATSILLGVALAAWLAIHGPSSSRIARITLEVAGLAGAVVLALAWTRLDGQSSTDYHGGFLVCGLAATALIAAAVHPEPGPVSRALSLRPLCALGVISYGVYLYHWPIDIVLDQPRVGHSGWPLFLIQTAATLTAAIASYHLIEQPIRRGALSSVQWLRLTPAIAIALVLAILITTNGAQPFVPIVFPGNPVKSAARLRRDAPANALRVMIVGDSVGALLGQAMQTITTNPPVVVLRAALGGCAFPTGITRVQYRRAGGATSVRPTVPCDPIWEDAALRRFRPDVVLWIVSNPSDRMWYRGHWLQACTEPYESLYRSSLRKEVAVLAAHDAKVVITTTAYPETPATNRRTDCDNALRRQVAMETGARLVDLFNYICPHGICRVKQDGMTLRPDGLHYAGPGGQTVAKWLVDQIT
jgi:peptidoglycan/LPS O-acetylase OafA/YrhL